MTNAKVDRLHASLAGEKPDLPPMMIWRHFPGDDLRSTDFAWALASFQRFWDCDVIRVAPHNLYAVLDYGLQAQWDGNAQGLYQPLKPLITRSLNWTELRRLDAQRGMLGQQIDAVQQLHSLLDDPTPIIINIPSPLTQAEQIAGRARLLRDMRTHPDRLKTGLNIITENILRFMDALAPLGLSGIAYDITMASHDILSSAEYADFGRPYDQKLLHALPASWWLTLVHVHGAAPMLREVGDYPAQILCWQDRDAHIALDEGKSFFEGIVCGGIGNQHPMHDGMPGEIRQQVYDALDATFGRHILLSTAQPLLLTTPLSNIRALGVALQERGERQ
ncbi:MAG: uroporphyrinogen decarboxylase family protein [Anaerolineales bacterium]